MFEITSAKIDTAALIAAVEDPACGAALLFVGVVRDQNLGRKVSFLEYEAYAPMARAAMERIATDLETRYAGVRAAIVHRIGRLAIGEASVAIACAAPHREDAYRASREAIERLKREVPVWKKEHFEGGAVWVEGPGAPPRPAVDQPVRP